MLAARPVCRQRDHELRSTDDTKGIVVAKRRHRGSAPTTSAPWHGMEKRQRPQGSRRDRGRTGQRRASCSWGAGTGPVKAAGRLISWVRRSRLGC